MRPSADCDESAWLPAGGQRTTRSLHQLTCPSEFCPQQYTAGQGGVQAPFEGTCFSEGAHCSRCHTRSPARRFRRAPWPLGEMPHL